MFALKKKDLDYRLDRMTVSLRLPEGDLQEINLSDGRSVTIELHKIGVFAKAIKRSTICIRKWEQKEIIPVATFRDASGRRLYAGRQIALVAYLLNKHSFRQGKEIPLAFLEDMRKYWPYVKKKILTPTTIEKGANKND